MATLYRKYRPKEFRETVGQNHIKITLQSEIQTGKIAHAYLFCGPRGVGKTTLARVFAKSINCLNIKEGEYEPCNQCESCHEIGEGRSLDIVEIDAASHTGVDNVRDNIIASARTAPSRSKFKVFIIDEVHMLSISAFNALLKIIEEPPAHVVFILCTTETHKVPTTIISRCQRFDFKRISVSDLSKKLAYIAKEEGVKVDKVILEKIARQSEGYARDAESLLGQVFSISGNEVTEKDVDLVIPRSDIGEMLALVDVLARKDASKGIELANKLVDNGVDLRVFTSGLIEIMRKLLLAKISPGLGEKFGLEFGETVELKLNELNKNLDVVELMRYIDKFIEVRNKVKDSFIIQLPLELAIVELCLASASSSQAQQVKSDVVSRPASIKTNSPSNETKSTQSIVANQTTVSTDANLTINDIQTRWKEFLVSIKKNNHSLSFILRASLPRELKGNSLVLVFKYRFHRDRLEDVAVRLVIEQSLAQVFNAVLTVEGVVDENIVIGNGNSEAPVVSAPLPSEENLVQPVDETSTVGEEITDNNPEASQSSVSGDDPMLNNILKTFGGKVVK